MVEENLYRNGVDMVQKEDLEPQFRANSGSRKSTESISGLNPKF
jgi:hypothetical protein